MPPRAPLNSERSRSVESRRGSYASRLSVATPEEKYGDDSLKYRLQPNGVPRGRKQNCPQVQDGPHSLRRPLLPLLLLWRPVRAKYAVCITRAGGSGRRVSSAGLWEVSRYTRAPRVYGGWTLVTLQSNSSDLHCGPGNPLSVRQSPAGRHKKFARIPFLIFLCLPGTLIVGIVVSETRELTWMQTPLMEEHICTG